MIGVLLHTTNDPLTERGCAERGADCWEAGHGYEDSAVMCTNFRLIRRARACVCPQWTDEAAPCATFACAADAESSTIWTWNRWSTSS